MGRLLEALRANSGVMPTAIIATPAIVGPEPVVAETINRRVAVIAEAENSTTGSAQARREPDQTGRLLAALRDEHLPDSLLSRDDSLPLQLAGLDSAGLRAYARALSRSDTMDAGMVPADYTQAGLCEGCGSVWLWEDAPARLRACPWCFRRNAGKGFARPQVTCGACRHFLPDPINPGAGSGACGVGLPYRRGEPGRWPVALRECDRFRPSEHHET